MPGMDGPHLVAECRQHWPGLPVIILTTLDDTTIIRRFLAAGAGLLSSLGVDWGYIACAEHYFISKNSGSLPLWSSCAASDKTAIFHASPGAAKSSKWYILMNTNQTGRIIVFAAITQVGDLESLRDRYTELLYPQSSEMCDGHKL